ncbi:unnamed protein product [Nezara viridula]|uniref:Neuropeptide n=1 Tax=Nezara viridula TaxID=85310 RepID=A0A9P0H0G5_NEZVI|nr:unnamed protein product [Nezara viridula]
MEQIILFKAIWGLSLFPSLFPLSGAVLNSRDVEGKKKPPAIIPIRAPVPRNCDVLAEKAPHGQWSSIRKRSSFSPLLTDVFCSGRTIPKLKEHLGMVSSGEHMHEM